MDDWDSIPDTDSFFFATAFRLALGPNQLPIQWLLGSLPASKPAGAWSWRLTFI